VEGVSWRQGWRARRRESEASAYIGEIAGDGRSVPAHVQGEFSWVLLKKERNLI
jgi:hypothetical protein